MDQKPPILHFAEFFHNYGMNRLQLISALECLEKQFSMSSSMAVALGFKSLEEVSPIQPNVCSEVVADLHDDN